MRKILKISIVFCICFIIIGCSSYSQAIDEVDRASREVYINDAKRMIIAAEYEIRSDYSIELPTASSITIIALSRLSDIELGSAPNKTKYSKEKSFVAILTDYSNERVYYAHLVSCEDGMCDESNDFSKTMGINLANMDDLVSSDRLEKVVKGLEVEIRDINSIDYKNELLSILSRQSIVIYD